MAKDLRTFIADCERQLPGEVIHVTKEVNPANYDVTAIIKHLGAQKKFPIIIFDNPINLNGRVGPIKLTMNCEISQGKTQIALRYVGNVQAKDSWSLSRKATLDYGLHYAHYGYLERDNLASPSMAVRLAAGDRSWVRASVSRAMRAPGAEEFVPAQFAGMWLPPQRTFAPLPGTEFSPQETRSVEVAFERQVGS